MMRGGAAILLLLAGAAALPASSLRKGGMLTSSSRASSTKLLVSAQLLIVDGNEDENAPDVSALEFDKLPVPLARVLLSEEGSADGSGAALSTEEDACALLAAAGLDDGEQLSLTLCDDAFIQQLNSEWRSVDAPTDVLSFPMDDEQLLGDLVISVDTAERQALERSYELRDEMRVLLVHGVLHLLGYDHETSDEEHDEMAAAERKLLTRLGWKGVGLIDAAAAVPTSNPTSQEPSGSIRQEA